MGLIQVKNVKIGQGIPKVIVPLMGQTEEELLEEVIVVKQVNPDMIEWRVDVFEYVDYLQKVRSMLLKLSKQLHDIPLIFTFRSHREGGCKKITDQAYVELLTTAIESGMVDLIDIELFFDRAKVETLIKQAQANQVCTILSNHDFNKTPVKDEITSRLREMHTLGADISKIAVTPNSTTDVLTLLEATNEMKTNHKDMPVITMAMGSMGLVSRLTGGVFGSAATFAVGKNVSAPGQIAISELRSVLNVIHQEGNN
jgi:3-dehydroquinate dehydratase-1